MTDADNNPFNGESVSETQMFAQWCTFMFVCPVAFLFLGLEAYTLGQGWAAAALPHGIIVWCCLALITWWRQAAMFVFAVLIAGAAAAKCFIKTWREECSIYF